MEDFVFEDYKSEDEENNENFGFSEAKQNVEILNCAFCKKLPTDPRVTSCCKKHVCFACWKDNCRYVDPNNSGKPFTKSSQVKQYVRYNHAQYMEYICRVCYDKVPVVALHAPKSFETPDTLLATVSKIYQQKLDDLMVICPGENCKVRLTVTSCMLFINIFFRKLFNPKFEKNTGRTTANDL